MAVPTGTRLMRAGALDHRWELLEEQETTDELGQPVIEWVTVATVWGSWAPLKGSEAWAAQQVVERSVARVRFRYGDGQILTAMHRVRHAELGEFEIVGEPEQRPRDGETVCQISRLVE